MSDLYLYNTLVHKKERFIPLVSENIRLYVCGPTIYDRIHLGNARCLLVFDVLYRLLRLLFSKVNYVRNITDIDDKIMQRAQQEQIDIGVLTQKTLKWFLQDVRDLGLVDPTEQPRATSFVSGIVAMIQNLLDKKVAYYASDHVFFSVRSWKDYGSLCRMHPDQMHAGARVSQDVLKQDPLDFVLWKPSESHQEGWESPWGRGRPGWHIECSVMSSHFLGPLFDIHGGGKDLLFPHHENERAQTCAAFGHKECSQYWVHTGMLTVDGKKMSKSLGNFVTLRDALRHTRPEILFWSLLSSHYRHGLDWNDGVLHAAERCVNYIYNALEQAGIEDLEERSWTENDIDGSFLHSLCDDLNTPKALSDLYRLASCVHKDPKNLSLAHTLLYSAQWLGLVQRTPSQWFREGSLPVSSENIQDLIDQRNHARQNNDYCKADKIRKDLEALSIFLEDTPQGTKWRRT